MSALDDFRQTGHVGDELALLTFRTVRLVAFAHDFPHPAGARWTSDDAVWDAVGLFFSGYDGARRLATLCMQATNDRHLASLLETTVLRWFQTLGRRSERGRLIRAIQTLMKEEPGTFLEVSPGKFWAPRDGPYAATTVALDELVAAAWTVPLEIIRAQPDAKKRSPFASREQRIALLSAILDVAGGAVHINDIAEAVAARVGLLDTPTVLGLDAADAPETTAVQRMPIEQEDRVRELFEQLGDRERIALAYYEAPIRDTSSRFGVPRSSLQDAKARVEQILRRHLEPADDDLVRSVRELCEAYAEIRTERNGLASTLQPEEEHP